ncbi:MAG: hypothetical protein H6697_02640 [Myxococcales bacterium]|nr:hypothetical protein [Myxococcales bacterium]MCB9521349.1 hypothetical protein [Myxococcales bacterium]
MSKRLARGGHPRETTRRLTRLTAIVAFAAAALGCRDDKSSGDQDGRRDIGTIDTRPGADADDSGGDATGGDAPDGVGDSDPDGSGDTGAGGDAGDATEDGSGTGDVGDLGDTTDSDGDGADADAPPECDLTVAVATGVLAVDLNGDPLEVADIVSVEVSVSGTFGAIDLDVDATNLDPDVATVTLDGAPIASSLRGSHLIVPLTGPGVVRFEAAVATDRELVMVFAGAQTEPGCPVDRSESAAILQVVGGTSKTPTCIDLRRYRSVQVAPPVARQNTESYRVANGVRDDLVADDFIFCPQHPTVVHVAEFCVLRDPGQSVTVAGSYDADGSWEVDDFALFEVFRGGALLADGFTTQHHNGGDTFWCGDISQLMCRTGCTASLTVESEDRAIAPVAVTEAQGATARQFADGSVDITSLLPADGDRADVRVTVLDQGVEGLLSPALYLIGGVE